MKITNTLLNAAALLAVTEAATITKFFTASTQTLFVTQTSQTVVATKSFVETIYSAPPKQLTSKTQDSTSPTTSSVNSLTSSSATSYVETTTPAPSSSTLTTSTISSSTASEDSDATPTADVEFAEEILKEHNVKRALHGVPALSWSNKLAEYAQDYANTGFDCSNLNLKHSGGPYGENLAAGYMGGISPVDAWYDEISMVDWNNVDFTESTGHFTQLVWRSTTQVGCAKMMCSTAWRQITVCEYLPRGNVIGLNVTSGHSYFVDNVLPPLK
ncbi:hypothetical protein MG5_01363 [Candida albicans P57072]|uniref:Repressed by EFG1 protein 1 n=3 Tax=Candida albicans TaxID=5476 RepID=RBE1_CANAL|eukprot:XP_715019.1 sterol-binding protein [Candida albicans SC5314]